MLRLQKRLPVTRFWGRQQKLRHVRRISLWRKSLSGASKVYGVISYDFAPPKPASAAASPATTTTTVRNTPKPEGIKLEAGMVPDSARLVESKPKAAANYSEVARVSYNKGVTSTSSRPIRGRR